MLRQSEALSDRKTSALHWKAAIGERLAALQVGGDLLDAHGLGTRWDG